ncbi:MAG: hypothetical protein ABH829_01540 [archaeon]
MRRLLYLFTIIGILVAPALCADKYIFVSIEGEQSRLDVDEQLDLVVQVFNPNHEDISVTLEVTGAIYSWATLKDTRLTVPMLSNASTTLYVDAPFDAPAGSYSIGVTAYLSKDKSLSGKGGYTLTLLPQEKVSVLSSTDKGEYSLTDEMSFLAEVENLGNVQYDDLTVKVRFLGQAEWSTEKKIFLDSKERRAVAMDVDLQKVVAGKQTVLTEVYAADNYLANTTNQLTIFPTKDISKTENSTAGFWRKTYTLVIENRGNTLEVVDVRKAFLPLEANFLSSSIEPARAGLFSSTWSITVLPGEKKVLEFYTYGTVLYIFDLIALLVFLGFGYLSIMKIQNRSPAEVTKGMVAIYSKGGRMDLTVSLLIKNKGPQRLTNILVTDSVPISVRVSRFRTARPTQINERKYEIEYMWSIHSLQPFEERVIVYDIGGEAVPKTLPQATVRSTNKHGKTLFHKSNIVRLQQP